MSLLNIDEEYKKSLKEKIDSSIYIVTKILSTIKSAAMLTIFHPFYGLRHNLSSKLFQCRLTRSESQSSLLIWNSNLESIFFWICRSTYIHSFFLWLLEINISTFAEKIPFLSRRVLPVILLQNDQSPMVKRKKGKVLFSEFQITLRKFRIAIYSLSQSASWTVHRIFSKLFSSFLLFFELNICTKINAKFQLKRD